MRFGTGLAVLPTSRLTGTACCGSSWPHTFFCAAAAPACCRLPAVRAAAAAGNRDQPLGTPCAKIGAAGAGCWCCCCSLRPPPPLFPAPPGSPARRRHQSDLCCGCCVVPTPVDDAGTAADADGRRLFFLPRASCVVCCRRARRTLCSCPTDCEKSIGGVERQRRQRGDAARHGTTSVFRRFCPALRAGT